MNKQIKIILTTDGASRNNQNRTEREAALGYLIERDGELIAEQSEYLGQGPQYTNNFSEYQAVINGVREVSQRFSNDQIDLQIKSDSEILVKQLAGEYSAKKMKDQYDICVDELSSLNNWEVEHVSQSPGNRVDRADGLAAEAFD